MVGAQHPLAVGQGLLVQRDRLVQPPRRPGRRQARLFREMQGVGVVGAQDPLAVGQGPLVQRDRLAQPPRRLVGGREVVPRGEGVGVVGAQHPLTVGQVCSNSGIASPSRPPTGRRRQDCPQGEGLGVVRAEHALAVSQGSRRGGAAEVGGCPQLPYGP